MDTLGERRKVREHDCVARIWVPEMLHGMREPLALQALRDAFREERAGPHLVVPA